MNRRMKLPPCPASPPLELPSPCRMCPDILVNYEALLEHIKEAHIINCCDNCNYWHESIVKVLDHPRENHPFIYFDEETQW